MEIQRVEELKKLTSSLKNTQAVVILGPRQCGKTTLAGQFSKLHPAPSIPIFDLENPTDLARLTDPMLALEKLKGIIIIDEIQRRPDLFPVLRVLIDNDKDKRFVILGSASRDLIRQSSETLAGRIHYLELGGFSLNIPTLVRDQLWLRGGLPPSYLAPDDDSSLKWRRDYILTFLERDIPNLGFRTPAETLHRFWIMLAHYHGQLFNASELAKSMDASHVTMKHYLDILTGTFMIRRLAPWHYNTKKRLIKAPKVYFRDSGIFHALLSIKGNEDLLNHPRLGASWEGFALEEAIRHLELNAEEVYFWGVHTGASLDIVFLRGGKMWGVEVKYQAAPSLTRSMVSALSELSLAHLFVIYPGKDKFPLGRTATALPLDHLKDISMSP